MQDTLVLAGTVVLIIPFLVMLIPTLVFRAISEIQKVLQPKPWIGFLHPYCEKGGGGERVLWLGVDALARDLIARAGEDGKATANICVYCGAQDKSASQIVDAAKERFGVKLSEVNVVGFDGKEVSPTSGKSGAASVTLRFVFVSTRTLLEASWYPYFTMIGQSVGSAVVAAECLLRLPPAVFVDTTGCAFTFPVAYLLGGSTVAAYVHYPTITRDMTRAVQQRRPGHNNSQLVSASERVTALKVAYYRAFAAAYAATGAFSTALMANSSWTMGHLQEAWGRGCASLVYPPCSAEHLAALPLEGPPSYAAIDSPKPEPVAQTGKQKHGPPAEPSSRWRRRAVLSIGQFRPEKDHSRQLRAFAAMLEEYGQEDWAREATLELVGGCRGAEDEARVQRLREEAAELGIGQRVRFHVNAPQALLVQLLGECRAGIHTMWNEHFGIGVVEMQAAGCVPVAHNSGGPRADIVRRLCDECDGEAGGGLGTPTGLLAALPTEFADAMAAVLRPSDGDENVVVEVRAGKEAVSKLLARSKPAHGTATGTGTVTGSRDDAAAPRDPGAPLAVDYHDAGALRASLRVRTAPSSSSSSSSPSSSSSSSSAKASNSGASPQGGDESSGATDRPLLLHSGATLRQIAEAGRQQAFQFTDSAFEGGFVRALVPALRAARIPQWEASAVHGDVIQSGSPRPGRRAASMGSGGSSPAVRGRAGSRIGAGRVGRAKED